MAKVPYARWAAYIDDALRRLLPVWETPPLVTDLACGTGNITLPLAQMGYDMTGVDVSAEMLSEARAKAEMAGLSILWLAQDIRQLDLYGTMDAFICVCDGLNYLLTDDDLSAAFMCVSRFLNHGGAFIFDVNTAYNFEHLLGNKTYEENANGVFYTWKNKYDPRTCINESTVTINIAPDKYKRRRSRRGYADESYTEIHRQRAYPHDMLTESLNEAGFTLCGINDDYTYAPASTANKRLTYAAVKM
jgi:SAM-dependent methyltransferase